MTMTHEKLKNCIGQYRELKKDLWWLKKWGIQKVKGYDFGVYYNDFDGHWQLSWNDPENEHRIANVEDIFETKEEAEWHEEFGCIERTECLKLPTWEELQNETKKNNCYGCEIFFMGFDEEQEPMQYVLDVRPDDKIYIGFTKEIGSKVLDMEFEAPTTKENYTIACRKAKQLFLKEIK